MAFFSRRRSSGVAKGNRSKSSLKLEEGGADEGQLFKIERTPPPTPPSVVRSVLATECTDLIFHRAKLKVQCPPRWKVLFLAAAKRTEKRLDVMREEMFAAAAVDDIETLKRLKTKIPPMLWKWWSYDLELVERASSRSRPFQLGLMPELKGAAYRTAKSVALARAAIEVKLFAGSPEATRARQRGELFFAVIQRAIERKEEIDVDEIEELLAQPGCGKWKDSMNPAAGVNYGAVEGKCAGWRPLHFVSAANSAQETGSKAANTFLDARADPLLCDAHGATALHVAAANDNLAVTEVLLKRGAPLETPDHAGCTALLIAARCRNAAIVRCLASFSLPSDVSVGILNSLEERQAQRFSVARSVQLHMQVGAGDRDKVRDLILVGDGQGGDLADVNFADSLGRSPLHSAVTTVSGDGRAVDMLRALVALRADVDARDFQQETALHYAARSKRPALVRTLLRLRAHPNVSDSQGRTPLMLAAATRDGIREPPAYDGTLVNPPVAWSLVESILVWDGQGEPPGPPPRRVKEKEKSMREQIEEKKKGGSPKAKFVYMTAGEITRARAEALAALGFDDQWIINQDGRINRGDRLHLWRSLLQPRDRDTFLQGNGQKCGANAVRMQIVWDALTGPMMRMELQGTLPARLYELLRYLLMSILGPSGLSFGILSVSAIGTSDAVLPSWDVIEGVLDNNDDLASRIDAFRRLGFRGPLPKLAAWVGSVWARDDYPRDPQYAPWEALEYVDQDTAIRLNEGANQIVREFGVVSVITEFTSDNDEPVTLKVGQRGRVREIDKDGDALIKFDDHEVGQLVFQEKFENLKIEATFQEEAFYGNYMPAFDQLDERTALPTGAKPRPFRSEQMQLANRLFVNEPLGMIHVAEDRMRVAGELLLCPLLEDLISGFTANGTHADAVAERRQWLRYVASQMDEPAGVIPEPPSVADWEKVWQKSQARRKPFAQAWKKTRLMAAQALSVDSSPGLATLTPGPDVCLLEGGEMTSSSKAIPEQTSVLPHEIVLWLQAKYTTHAFVELRNCDAVASADDFNDVIKGVVAKSPKYFAEHFWRATFYLLLWGRAKHLQPFFLKELKRRLPDGTVLDGPSMRPRSDYMVEMDRKAQEDALQKRREDACWVAWNEAEALRKQAVGKLGPEARAIRAAAKIVAPRVARHLRTWRNVAFVGEPTKPNSGEEGLASGGGVPAARMLHGKAPPAVERELAESTAATGADGLPTGLTDVLSARVVCDSVDVFRATFAALCAPPPPPPRPVAADPAASPDGDAAEPRGHIIELRVQRIVNDFHPDQAGAVFPRAARVLLLACFSVCPRGVGTVPVQQLVEIEILMPFTSEARWLAEYLELDPAERLLESFDPQPRGSVSAT